MSDEHFGTEPPGPGWLAAGEGRWLRTDSDGHRIAIIGGGPGGLFVSWLLNDAMPDANLTIFEATDRLGGKIETKRFRDGTPYESGVAELYEYLGPVDDALRMLIEEELGLRTVDISGGGVIMGEHVLRDAADIEEAFGAVARLQIERFHERCAELMPLEKYATRWQPDNAHPWARKTFRECLEQEVTDENARAYIHTAVHSDLATEAHSTNGLNALKNVLMDNDKYLRLYHVVGGIGKIVKRLDEEIEADVRFGCRVTAVGKTASGYRVTFLCDGRESEQEFDAVIVCLPNHWLSSIRWGETSTNAMFGMVGDEWHGPTAPGPGWVQIGKGPRGGLRWKQQGGGQQPQAQAQQPADSVKQTLASFPQGTDIKTLAKKTGLNPKQVTDELVKMRDAGQLVMEGTKYRAAQQEQPTTPSEPPEQRAQRVNQAATTDPIVSDAIAQVAPTAEEIAARIRAEGGLHLGELMREYPDVPPEQMHDAIFQAWNENRDEFDLEGLSSRSEEWTEEEYHRTLPRSDERTRFGHIVSRKATPEQRAAVFGKRGRYTANPNTGAGQDATVFVPHNRGAHFSLTAHSNRLARAMHKIVEHYDAASAHYVRVSMLFRTAWWKRLGMPGCFWMWDGFGGCAIYDESARWRSKKGHVLSFLIAGNDALAMCSQNQTDREIIRCVLDSLPPCMSDAAREFVDGAVARYAGALVCQPGGWPAKELRGEHQPEPTDHPGVFVVGDYFFDCTLNGALVSAATTLDMICDHFGVCAEEEAASDVVAELAPSEPL